MQRQWSRQQLAVLQAMGTTLYQPRDNEQQTDENTANFYYRLGALNFVSATPLPVELPQWLQDLCCFTQAKPVAVSELSTEHCLSVEQCQQQITSTEGKRQLWQQVSEHLQLQ